MVLGEGTGMLPIVGYADRFSVAPGETIAFKVSSQAAAPFEASLVRVRCGDPNPAGPGMKLLDVPAPFAGRYPSRVQPVHLGSYVRVPQRGALAGQRRLTFAAIVWPSTPAKGLQGVLGRYEPASGMGLALAVDRDGAVLLAGDGRSAPVRLAVGKPLVERTWYRIWASWDGESGRLAVGQAPLAPAFRVDDAGSAVARGTAALDDGDLLIAALGGSPPSAHFNGRIEAPRILASASGEAPPEAAAPVLAAWDFARGIDGLDVFDSGPHGLDGRTVNLPTRAVTSSGWSGREMNWRHAPQEYAAIHFHDDDIHDCGWQTDFSFTVPDDLKSGVYGARLRIDGAEDVVPFFVRPKRGTRQADLVVLAPTFTYTIYGNHARGNTDDAYRARVAQWGARPWTADEHREYGFSTYNFHSDRSGIAHASRLRPVITMRPGFVTFVGERYGSGLRHFPADTHIYDWLEAKGIAYDVVTDEDLHAEGVGLIAGYRALLTGSHPEYHTAETLDALAAYTAQGGRMAYLGGNGFYWRIAVHPDVPGAVEIRRGEGGIRAWAAEPGEYYNAFDGAYGGLWRRSRRYPQMLCGVGFSGQGLFEGSYYRRKPAAADPRAAWIFEGVEDEILGDFGLNGGGAAGFELDRADRRLGTPAHALVVASSEGHRKETFVLVPEEMLTHVHTLPGEPVDRLIRADMVYYETPNGGAVFSVGSITFCGSLAHGGYDNNISRILLNVVRRFLSS